MSLDSKLIVFKEALQTDWNVVLDKLLYCYHPRMKVLRG